VLPRYFYLIIVLPNLANNFFIAAFRLTIALFIFIFQIHPAARQRLIISNAALREECQPELVEGGVVEGGRHASGAMV